MRAHAAPVSVINGDIMRESFNIHLQIKRS